ncbi:Clp protease ClpP, partial [Escherichia coli]|nr:Clp protease ClpP [Escherichia coli]
MKTADWGWSLIRIPSTTKEATVPELNDSISATPKASMKNKSWFRMQAGVPGDADIYIYDEIGFWGVTAKQFVSELNA